MFHVSKIKCSINKNRMEGLDIIGYISLVACDKSDSCKMYSSCNFFHAAGPLSMHDLISFPPDSPNRLLLLPQPPSVGTFWRCACEHKFKRLQTPPTQGTQTTKVTTVPKTLFYLQRMKTFVYACVSG